MHVKIYWGGRGTNGFAGAGGFGAPLAFMAGLAEPGLGAIQGLACEGAPELAKGLAGAATGLFKGLTSNLGTDP